MGAHLPALRGNFTASGTWEELFALRTGAQIRSAEAGPESVHVPTAGYGAWNRGGTAPGKSAVGPVSVSVHYLDLSPG